MYGFKGFMEIDGLQSTTPGQVGTIGDLSSKAQTFSRSLAQYTTPTFPSLMLYSFKSRTESGNITIPALLQTQIFAVANWAYQYQRAQTAAITSGAFVAAASAQFSGQAVSFSCGEMIQADGFSFPSFIRWINPTLATNSPNAGAEVKIWFSDLAFQAQYDEYEIVVVPPIPNISLFHSGAAVVQAAIDAYSHNSLISAIQAASGVYPYTSLQARRFSYVDPTNVQNRIMTDWTLLIYGPAGNNIDAMQLAKTQGAHVQRYPHADLATLERLLADSTAQRKLIVTDSIFSMDGDLAPLPALLALARTYDAFLIVDDAHGFGVLGPQGRGSLAHFALPADPRLILMGTLGKAAGVGGAFVAASAEVIETLICRARSYIFTTASPPAMSCALLASLRLIEQGDALRQSLFARIQQLRLGLQALTAASAWRLPASLSAIQPLIIGPNEACLQLANALMEKGFWVPAIRPPTVPQGSARLRISLSAAHTPADIDGLLAALQALAN